MYSFVRRILVFAIIVIPTVPAASDTVELTIAFTSDLHGSLFNYDYARNQVDERGGLVKLATIIRELREENPNLILLDNGDTIQGTAMTDDLFNTRLSHKPHPMIKAMNYLGYDAMTIGNHEFNFGLELIKKIESEANFPFLAANTLYREDDSYFAQPYTILERAGLNIAVMGFTTPNVPRWDGPKVTDLRFLDMSKKAVEIYQHIQNNYSPDIVIVTAHAGLDGRHDNRGSAAKYIAKKLPDIAALLIGHDHRVYETKVNDIMVLAPAAWGTSLARLDIQLKKTDKETIITGMNHKFYCASNYCPDPELVKEMQYVHDKTIAFIEKPLTTVNESFLPESDINHPAIPIGRLKDSAIMDLINNVQMKYVPGAQISAAALFLHSSNFLPGEISYSDIFGIYRFPNTLYGVKITGEELKNYLEWSASYFNTYTPGDITISFDPEARGYNYDMFQGIEYKIDISQKPYNRIKGLRFEGEPVKDEDLFKIAINNYRYNGLKSMEMLSHEPFFMSDPKAIRSYIMDYISQYELLKPTVDNNWKIVNAPLDHPARDYVVYLINNEIFDIPQEGRSWNSRSINMNRTISMSRIIKMFGRIINADLSTFKKAFYPLTEYLSFAKPEVSRLLYYLHKTLYNQKEQNNKNGGVL